MTRYVFGVNGGKMVAIPSERQFRLFPHDHASAEGEVDWPATIPFVAPKKTREKITSVGSSTPKLRIFNG